VNATVVRTMTQNLHAMADILAEVPNPPYVTTSTYDGSVQAAWFLMHDPNREGQKSTAAAVIRAIGGHWDKTDLYSDQMVWNQTRDGLRFHVAVLREAVCERIVTGTHMVTIPAVEAKPERTETVETVEWRCLPLLPGEASS
jgi:hypothetical protein